MPKVIVVPAADDQAAIASGADPDVSRIYSREFASAEETEAYVAGAEFLYDGMQYSVVSRHGWAAEILVYGETVEVSFVSESELDAFLAGLEDADGWNGPLVLREDDGLFPRLDAVLNPTAPAIG